MKVLAFGEILWDVFPHEKHIGGAPFNFAAHLARHGEEAYMVSCLGQDDLGEEALRHLRECGIRSDFVSRSALPTGWCEVTLDENAVPSYDLKQNVAYDYIDCDGVDGAFDVLYFGALALRGAYNPASLSRLLKTKTFQDVFVDVNIRAPFYSEESVTFCVENATILKISEEELPVVGELLSIDTTGGCAAVARRLKEAYANLKIILITLGAEGAFCYDGERREAYKCAPKKVTVASTVGAGDSFSAAFLHRYMQGEPLLCCLAYASEVAAFVVSKTQAVPPYTVADFTGF